MTTVPSQDFDVIADLLCAMFVSEEVRAKVVARASEHNVGSGDLLKRIFAGDRSAEIYPTGRIYGEGPGLFARTDDLEADGHFSEEVQIDGTPGKLLAQAEYYTLGPDGELGEATPVPMRVVRDEGRTPRLEGDLMALVAVLRGEHPEDGGDSYGRKTPDPFEPPGEAILVKNAVGVNICGIIKAVGQERVDECSFLASENPDRTVRVIKMPREPRGRDMACAPRSFVPEDHTIIDYMEVANAPASA